MNTAMIPTPTRTVYEYRNSDGTEYCQVVRVDNPDNGKDIFTLPSGLPGPHPLYHADKLAALPGDTLVYIVEGEKCVEALEAVGLVATTARGGSNSANQTDWTLLQRFETIVILPDNDAPGRKYAQDVLHILQGLPGARRVKVVDLPGLDAKGDVFDFLQDHSADDLMMAIDQAPAHNPTVELATLAALAGTQEYDKTILIRDIPTAEAYPIDNMGSLQPVVEAIAQQVQVPVATAAQSILAATALAVQQHGNWCIDGRVSPASLFCMSICGTGDRKSAVDKIALWPHRGWQDDQFIQYECDLEIYKKEKKAYAAAVKNAERKGNREAISAAIRAVGPEPIAPLQPAFILGNMTAEGLHRQLCEGIPSCGVFTDEGGSLIGGYAMAKENMLKTLSDFSKLWDVSSEIRVRAGAGMTSTKGKRVSMHIMMQPDVAAMLFHQRIAHNQGFLPRVLVVWPESLRGTRGYQKGDIKSNPHIQRYNDRILQILNAAPEYENERQDTLVPYDLVPTPEAYELWVAFYEAVEHQNAPGASLDCIAGWASKAAEHAGRIATVLALYDGINQVTVSTTHMKAGIALAEFYMNEMYRVHAQGQHDALVLDADLLLKWMQDKAQEVGNVFTSTILLQQGPYRIRDAVRLQEVCTLLHTTGAIEPIPGKGKKWRLS